MNISTMSLGRKITLGSIVLAIFSLFLPWVDFFITANGFEQQGYIFLIAYIYPLYCIIKNVPMNKILGIICGLAAVVASIIYIMSKIESGWGMTINANGTGIYVFLASAILLTLSALMKNK
jgi:hypothetical protein